MHLFLQKVLVWMKGFEDQLATVADTIANDSDTVKWQISFLTVSFKSLSSADHCIADKITAT